jgi:two-component system sporulation sensor kinase B
MRKNLQFGEKEFILGPENAYLLQTKGLQGMHIESNLILNVFIILLPIMFYRFVCKSKKTVLYFLLFLVPLIITMSFPVKVFNTFLDLRGIPLVAGSLYGGVYSALLLFASAIIYRQVLGDIHIVYYTLSLLPTLVLVCLAIPVFNRGSFMKRMLIVLGLCFFLRITVLNIYYLLDSNPSYFLHSFVPSLPIVLMQCAMSVLLVYILETVRRDVKIQEEMIEAEKLKVVSEIAASVAHEVRNPLTTVRGFVQLLGEPSLTDQKRKEFSLITLVELDRAGSIISDYLSLAKPQNQKLEPISLNEEFLETSHVLSSYANLQNVKMVTEFHSSGTIYGDKSKLRQAIINLCKNAVEAMPDGGVLTIKYFVDESDNKARIYISDTGVGMTKEQIKRLGSPYYSTKLKGTGLGTMVTFNIIREMNGQISIESKEGEGTTFIITLPLYTEKEDAAHSK